MQGECLADQIMADIIELETSGPGVVLFLFYYDLLDSITKIILLLYILLYSSYWLFVSEIPIVFQTLSTIRDT